MRRKHLLPAFRWMQALTAAIFCAALPLAAGAQTAAPKIGVVVMHGKGGTPARHVSELADHLERKGYLVANPEMPWSGRRNYDVPVAAAEQELEAALEVLRSKGAQKLFVAGHSFGGLFALYFAGRHAIDGVIAMAPGGDVGNRIYREKLGESVELARQFVAGQKGNEPARLSDYEGSRGIYPIVTIPAAYLSWFEPDGAMNQTRMTQALKPQTPVLYISPRNDYPGLLTVKQRMFNALPANALNRLYEPDASHLGAPSAARDEIVRWTTEVAGAGN
ncbi:MAG: alpha/beta fold hydrolase [Pseudomonadota bacterium]